MRIKLIDSDTLYSLMADKIVTIGRIYDTIDRNTDRYDMSHVMIIDDIGHKTAIFDDEYEVVSDESK